MSVHHQASKYKARLAKQAIYQADYRERMKRRKRPERPDQADALLRALAMSLARQNTTVTAEVERKGLVFKFMEQLRMDGFDVMEAADAFQKMIDRFRDAEERKRRSAELEAAYQRRLRDDG